LLYVLCVIALLFGLTIGSFLNVVIYRLPRKESLSRPASHCPRCDTAIKWYDNVPVASWIALRGRCRSCGQPIAIRYPIVESMTGIGFALATWRFGVDWRTLVACAFVAALVAIAFIDYDEMIIADSIVLPGAVVGLGSSIALDPGRWWIYVVSSVGCGVFFLALVLLWPGGGMGAGDAKMGLFMGAVLGPRILVAVFVAFLLGSVVGIYLMVVKKAGRKTRVPFGPFLAVGAVLALFVGQMLVDAYTGIYS
jgi:leader peptidase (prepilin peptidase) / N-methyltransferase